VSAVAERVATGGLGRILKFGLVGAANNAVGYGIFVVLSLVGTGHIPAMTVSYVVGMGISFWGNRSWTFSHRGAMWPTVVRFLGANAVGYAVNFAVLNVLVTVTGVPQIPAQLVATAVVAACTFTLMRAWVFRERTARNDA
jgi:putative flippase GtrA